MKEDPTRSSEIRQMLRTEYGLEAMISRLDGENENYLVVAEDGSQRVLKLCGQDQTSAAVELENLAVERVAEASLELEVPHIVRTQGGSVECFHSNGKSEVRGRLLCFVAGTPWGQAVPASIRLKHDLGRRLARLATALSGIRHPASQRTHQWDLSRSLEHRSKVTLIDSTEQRRILDQAFLLFAANALPWLEKLPHGLIHGDLNDENVLVSEERVCGLLDFGDCLDNPLVSDLAIALSYVLLDEPDPLEAGAEIIGAYHRERSLTAPELEVVFPLICCRLAVSLVTAAGRRQIDSTRSAWFVTEKRSWRALARYVGIPPRVAAECLAGKTGVAVFPDSPCPLSETLKQRRKYFSGALSLTYQDPLKICRGRDQFLYDEKERPYLDLYNNVCHVGHCHPRVVQAGALQMARLNTNTRYLYEELAEYAERLCNLLPHPLERCFFVNSGSEANELALRLARAHTGRYDMLVVEGAYHGHTTTMIDISPYKFRGPGGVGSSKDWVHVVPLADGYRGPFKGQGRDAGVRYASEVQKVIESSDRPIAGFITESLLSCGGQVIPPEGYLETAFGHVRAAGGVCIADEVQVGFGRVGTHFWAFELQNVVPDIVVMGKPIGNGHPMAAVVTTPEISDSFTRAGMEFFSTCGGNPVSCAIGRAVLDVIQDEGLQERARQVGSHLLEDLLELKQRHPLVGDVRGVGLFIGIELVRNLETLQPAAEEAALLVDQLCLRGILTATDGPFHNVIKIKPPLVVTQGDAEMAVRVIDDLLP